MKKMNKKILMITAIVAMIFATIGILAKEAQAADSFPSSFDAYFIKGYGPTTAPTMTTPPIQTNKDGKDLQIFCCEANTPLRYGKNYTFEKLGIFPLRDQMACALGTVKDYEDNLRYKQALIWGDYQKGGMAETGNLKIDLSDGMSSKERHYMLKVGAGDVEKGKRIWNEARKIYLNAANYNPNFTFKFENTNPTLKVNSDGTYKIGPFKINYTKSDWSKISAIYLEDNNGKQHKVDIAPKDVPVNANFYVTVNQAELKDASSVKLVAKYSHENYTGTFARYKPKGYATHQNLVILDVNHETKEDTKDFGKIVLTMDLKGRAFIDGEVGKNVEPDGMDKDRKDTGLAGIEVTLIDNVSGKEFPKTKTDDNGYYEFKEVPAVGTYYVRFKYNGQIYEPTTYNYKKAKLEEKSYATDGVSNRKDFNNKFAEVTYATDALEENRQIYAYTGHDGKNGLRTYSINNSKEELSNINFGVIEREKANVALYKDLWEVHIGINGKNQTYIYNSRNEEDMNIALRGTDVAQYERAIRKADIEYAGENPLSITLVYRTRVYNGSGFIDTEVTNLIEYYDMDYEYVTSYTYITDEEQNQIKQNVEWNSQGIKEANGYKYNVMTTAGYATGKIVPGDSRYVFTEYKVKPEAIKDLLNAQSKSKETYSEIGAYKTSYRETKLDLNKQLDPNDKEARVMHEKDENAGLIDINSRPGNFDPTNIAVQNFIKYSKTEEYKQKYPEPSDKVEQSMKYFEDDADKAPSLTLTRLDDPRTLSGNVWDDQTVVKDLIRKGNGTREAQEKLLNKVKVQLVEIKSNGQENVIAEARTNNGYYEFKGYIPGDYKVRFIYGDKEALEVDDAKYTGQDYKSTIYDANAHKEDTYWYTNTDALLSDATDDKARRAQVNDYSKTLNNYKANILNKSNIEELAEATWMKADTNKMVLEVEYARTQTSQSQINNNEYKVSNIDFGIAERPHSELKLEKNVTHLKLITSDGQTIFDTDQKVPNLSWMKDKQIQATVDDNLIHGATIELDYTIKVTNIGERDYTDETFYVTGNVTDERNIVKTTPTQVVDYIANNLNYSSENEANKDWEIVKTEDLQKGNKDSLVNDTIDLKQNHVIVKANKQNPLVTTTLKPGESSQSTMKLTKVMAIGEDASDTLTYENSAEVVELKNDAGRRSYGEIVSIPGNLNPTNPEYTEPDSARAEEVVVLGPFGQDNLTVYYIVGTVLVAILGLGVGIFFIKKKVVNKD